MLGLGCNNFGLRMPVEDRAAVIHKALDLGITFFDTADVYGNSGGSETALGQLSGQPAQGHLPRVQVRQSHGRGGHAEGRLAPLRHVGGRGEPEAPEDRLDRSLPDASPGSRRCRSKRRCARSTICVKQGKIRYIGFSQLAGWELADRHWTARHHGLEPGHGGRDRVQPVEPRSGAGARAGDAASTASGCCRSTRSRAGFSRESTSAAPPMPEGARLTKGKSYSELFMTEPTGTCSRSWKRSAPRGAAACWSSRSPGSRRSPSMLSVIAGATRAEQVESNAKAIEWELTAGGSGGDRRHHRQAAAGGKDARGEGRDRQSAERHISAALLATGHDDVFGRELRDAGAADQRQHAIDLVAIDLERAQRARPRPRSPFRAAARGRPSPRRRRARAP